MIDLYKVFLNWYENSGDFECYFKSTPFTTLKHYLNDVQIHDNIVPCVKNVENITKLDNKGIFKEDNVMYLIDLPAEDSVDYALLLNNNFSIKPILSYNHIFNKYGIVGNNDLASKLICYADKLIQRTEHKAFSFIMDYNRYVDDIDLSNPMLYNNQYEVTEEELPYIEIIKEMNINKLYFITNNGIKEDIVNYLNYLSENGLTVEVITLEENK